MDVKNTDFTEQDFLVVYTALFGDYDELIDPPQEYDGCVFVCFTDQKNIQSNVWRILLVEDDSLPPNIMNRKYKMLPHIFLPEYKYSLYLDANIKLKSNPRVLLNKYLSNSLFVAPKHYCRSCIYEEAVDCIITQKDSTDKIVEQMKGYKKRGMPAKFGLSENNILLRSHNEPEVSTLMEDWWREIQNKSNRDQLSLPFLMWDRGWQYAFMAETSRNNNEYFTISPHLKYRSRPFLIKLRDKIKLAIRRVIVKCRF